MPVKVQRSKESLDYCRVFEWPAFMSYSWHVSQVATKACLTVLHAASMDGEMGLPVCDMVGFGFILFWLYFLPPIVV
jgi:hypothetical protein